MVKNLPVNARDVRDVGSTPGSGSILVWKTAEEEDRTGQDRTGGGQDRTEEPGGLNFSGS